MAIKIKFDSAGNPQEPSFILANQIGEKYGMLSHLTDKIVNGNLLEPDTITFTAHKGGNLWDKIKDFKTVWCKEWDEWFQAHVVYTDERHTYKQVELKGLGESELSQLLLFDYEINTETDIDRDDYKPSIVYNGEDTEHSILHRLLSVAPHYTIEHVDPSIASIQRSFSFNSTDLYSALQSVASEVNMLVVCNNGTNPETGLPARALSFYDLDDVCRDCGYRGEISDVCPKCGGTNIKWTYGNDTNICFSTEDLAEEISIDSDEDSMKNCFRLEGGDDLFTSTVRQCLPDSSGYYWYITDEQKEDMPERMASKITDYQEDFAYYSYEHQTEMSEEILESFSSLANKYEEKYQFEQDMENIVGFHELNQAIYEIIDFSLFLENSMMPDWASIDTDSEQEAQKITNESVASVAVPDDSYISSATAGNAVLSFVKTFVNPNFKVEIEDSSFSEGVWTGTFRVTNYYDKEDTTVSSQVSSLITNDFGSYVSQKLNKALAANQIEDRSITGLFALSGSDFEEGLTEYNYVALQYIQDACQSCLDILVENNVSDHDLWINNVDDLYVSLYVPYLDRYRAISRELGIRQSEIEEVNKIHSFLLDKRSEIQDGLILQDYLGDDWSMMYVYRREDTYQNSNYISEGLTTAELFKKAMDFLDVAIDEIRRASTPNQTVSANLHNLLVIDKYKSLADTFEVGNIIRAKVDNKVYKFKLLSYQIDYDDLSTIDTTFSNVIRKYDGVHELRQKLNAASSIASSYNATIRQAENGADASNKLNNWINDGLSMTQMKLINDADNQNMVYDSHGVLMRRMDDILDDYDPIQMKWINSTLAITPDNWETTAAVFGKFFYRDPADGEYKIGYGINGAKIIGDLIMGNALRIIDSNGNDIISVMDDRIRLQVDSLDGRVTTIEQNENSIDIRVQALENDDHEIDHVTTATGYTFNADGLNIYKDGEEMRNLLDNTGMYVTRSGEEVLSANNEGVSALNLTSRQFLIIGENSRFENYDNGTDGNRTACFYIGN